MPPKSKISASNVSNEAASTSRSAPLSAIRSASLRSAAAKLVSARAAAVRMAATDAKAASKPKDLPPVGEDAVGKTQPVVGVVGGDGAEAKADPRSTQAKSEGVVSAPRRPMASMRQSKVRTAAEPEKGTVEVVEKRARRTTGDAQATAAVEPQVTAVEAPAKATEPAKVVDAPRAGLPPATTAAAKPAVKAPVSAKGQAFKTHEYIVYPAHGVGQIVAVEEQVVAGYKLELFVISFSKDKMILKVPLPKVTSVGMRKLAEPPVVKRALDPLTGRARIKRTMWSRRAQEYEAKINSGDLVAIAEVVRDLYRSDAQPEQSYSERQLYEAALDRIARELAVVEKLTDSEALKLIDGQLQKGPRRTKPDEASLGDEVDDSEEQGIGEAA